MVVWCEIGTRVPAALDCAISIIKIFFTSSKYITINILNEKCEAKMTKWQARKVWSKLGGSGSMNAPTPNLPRKMLLK